MAFMFCFTNFVVFVIVKLLSNRVKNVINDRRVETPSSVKCFNKYQIGYLFEKLIKLKLPSNKRFKTPSSVKNDNDPINLSK